MSRVDRDLKDPGEAIPKGTFAAIATTLTSYIVYVIITGSVAVSYVPIPTFPDSEMGFSTENIENVTYRTDLNCSAEGKVLLNCEWGLVGTEYQKVQTNKSRVLM